MNLKDKIFRSLERDYIMNIENVYLTKTNKCDNTELQSNVPRNTLSCTWQRSIVS